MLMLVCHFFGLANHLVYSSHKRAKWIFEHEHLWHGSNTKFSNYVSFWRLDYFFDVTFLKYIFHTRKTLDDKSFIFFFLNPANHIAFFSVISMSGMEPVGEIPTKAFPVWVFYVIEKVCVLKARLQSSGLTLNHGNIASIKGTHATKILWTVLSWICNMYVPMHHYGKHFYTQSWLIKIHLFYQWPESHTAHTFWVWDSPASM